jgi:hypothetical protein
LVGSPYAPGQANLKAAHAFELNVAGELQADKAVEVEVAAGFAREVQGVRGLQGKGVVKEAVDAFAAFKPEWHQCRLTRYYGNGGTADSEGTRGVKNVHCLSTLKRCAKPANFRSIGHALHLTHSPQFHTQTRKLGCHMESDTAMRQHVFPHRSLWFHLKVHITGIERYLARGYGQYTQCNAR